MKYSSDTLDWLLKASLWIAAQESPEDSFEALRSAKDELIDDNGSEGLDSLVSESKYRLLEAVVWVSTASRTTEISSNLITLFRDLKPENFMLDEYIKYFGQSLFECEVTPDKELSEFWNIRVDSAKQRGASAAEHTLLDYTLKTVELGVHPLKPDPVSFIVGSFSEKEDTENPNIRFPIEIYHRSARVTIRSDQFVSIHEKVVWIDDSSGRMGVVGGEPLPVIGQPEGAEPALLLTSDGEKILQPFHDLRLLDGDEYING